MNEMPEAENDLPDRWTLIRDVGVLQVKLVIDGLRDLVLVPVSLIAGFVSLASGEKGVPGTQFYRLLSVGKQSERWINLFGAMENAPPDMEHPTPFPDSDMDEIVGKIEAFVVNEEQRGGMTAQARKRFDKAIDALQKKR